MVNVRTSASVVFAHLCCWNDAGLLLDHTQHFLSTLSFNYCMISEEGKIKMFLKVVPRNTLPQYAHGWSVLWYSLENFLLASYSVTS